MHPHHTQLTREKQQALLISSYKRAVALLHRASTQEEGKQMLLHILNDPDCDEPALK